MRTVLLALFLLFGMTSLHAQFLDGKKNLTKFNGFFNFFYAEDDGSILLEVREAGELKVFTESDERGEEGLMPWNKPESWEGAPTVPGLSP